MEELIAKRYVKALEAVASIDELKEMEKKLVSLANLFKDCKVKEFLLSPEVKKEEKLTILLDALKGSSEKFLNLIKLLVEKGRVAIIPAMAKELKTRLAFRQKSFDGYVYSEFELSKKDLEELQKALEKRVSGKVILHRVSQKYDGIRVEVESVGLEVAFSKSKVKKQLIENILQAI